MDITAVICEYNPFHKGHKYQINEIKKSSPDTTVLCIMSPNFVQRGSAAIYDKYTRAHSALLSGADIVLSMPQCFALLSAEGFARCGVKIASLMGATSLAFGVENDDEEVLKNIAKTLALPEFEKALSEEIKKAPSESFPKNREKALLRFLRKEEALFIREPNNILAVEYIKAINDICPDMEIKPIKRVGNGHLDNSNVGEYISASGIRQTLKSGEDILPYLPLETHSIIKDSKEFDMAKYHDFLYSALTTSDYEKIFNACGNKELTDIVFASAKKFPTYSDFRSSLSRKKHPETKIDRVLTNVLLNLKFDSFLHETPSYANVLAINHKGRKVISNLEKDSPLILLSRGAQYKRHLKNSDFKKQVEYELMADRIYSRCFKNPCGEEYFINKKTIISEDVK